MGGIINIWLLKRFETLSAIKCYTSTILFSCFYERVVVGHTTYKIKAQLWHLVLYSLQSFKKSFRYRSRSSGSSSLLNQVDLVVDLDHGAHQAVWDLQALQDVEDVHFLVHRLWVADVPHVHYEVLEHAREHEGAMFRHRSLLIKGPLRYR